MIRLPPDWKPRAEGEVDYRAIAAAQLEALGPIESGFCHFPVQVCQWFLDTDVKAIAAYYNVAKYKQDKAVSSS